jgi:hypothetical protein
MKINQRKRISGYTEETQAHLVSTYHTYLNHNLRVIKWNLTNSIYTKTS